ncbi:dihydropteroate synthase [Dethiosulfovibrio peptidovorans DSM 11002]|uniref:dihydropteroate synthase n=1 Tax=Dethiosulfovibrio peptidovorans DSM 11002 TaxID=469381 RepID=D2Z7N7_9BACT|nr:dihydropteroate synthase [Dethiosulfovibrio peptidovorans]EFC91484.1 dihydropteroate synthase [Dethiosulfovibrio peptidovorans DSM 11002]
MTTWFHRFRSTAELKKTLEEIGCDPGALPYFNDRRDLTALRISDVDTRAANALKQEMLSRGGDVAVHRHAIDRGVERCDCLLFGTDKQIAHLAEKLAVMPYWGLDQVRKEILDAMAGKRKRRHLLTLPGDRVLQLGDRTKLMAIVNLTEDSFFSKSRAGSTSECLKRVETMIEDGADMLDLGAESTRPGSLPAEAETEIIRLVPAVESIREEFPHIPISIDTTKSEVARACVDAGADILNDISGLGFDPELASVAANSGAPLVIMHMKGVPRTMQREPHYGCLQKEICDYFRERTKLATKAGVPEGQIILDPGIGFGKTASHNLALLSHNEFFRSMGSPILIGHSRKSVFGAVLKGAPTEERLEATLAGTALCAWQGVEIIRVHDVKANRRVLDTIAALNDPDRVD